MTRNDLIDTLRNAAAALRTTRLSIPAFRQQTGVTRSTWEKHFDSWSEFCRAAGVNHGLTHENLVHPPKISREECGAEMRRVAALLGNRKLTTKEFTRHARFTAKPVIKRFGSWANALRENNLERCDKAILDTPLSVDECVLELQRVAKLLGTKTLQQRDLRGHSSYSAHRIARACGGWFKALSRAGLTPKPNPNRRIPIETVAAQFLTVVVDLKRIPTLQQLSRRSGHAPDTLSRNRGGYPAFKMDVIEYLIASTGKFPKDVLGILRAERTRLLEQMAPDESEVNTMRDHRQGRTLGFRGFAFAPTCEQDVVQLFGSVANELGFEIIGNRAAFPDCEARRRVADQRENFIKCLIEYEFSSRDFKKHRHDPQGCNLIVCWEHNWPDCPVEVLELKKAIKTLNGWS
jgi:hypothetical protein